MRRRIVFNPKTYVPPVPVKHYQAMARGEMRENKVFGTNFEDGEVLPETEEDVFQMIGFDAQKEYNPGEMTKMAREADKLCRKFKIGDYDPWRQAIVWQTGYFGVFPALSVALARTGLEPASKLT